MTATQYPPAAASPSLETLVAQHVDLVYSAALRQVRDPHLADDITQAVFLVMAQKSRRLPPHALLAPWLLKVTRYTALTALRARKRRQRHEDAASAQIPPHQAATDEQIVNLLDDALLALAEKDRQLIVLRYMQNHSTQQIAQTLRLRPNTASKRLTRALDRLRTYFQARGINVETTACTAVLAAQVLHPAPHALLAAVSQSAASGSLPILSTKLSWGVRIMAMSVKAKIAAAAITAAMIAGTAMVITIARDQTAPPAQSVPAASEAQTPTIPPGVYSQEPVAPSPSPEPVISDASKRYSRLFDALNEKRAGDSALDNMKNTIDMQLASMRDNGASPTEIVAAQQDFQKQYSHLTSQKTISLWNKIEQGALEITGQVDRKAELFRNVPDLPATDDGSGRFRGIIQQRMQVIPLNDTTEAELFKLLNDNYAREKTSTTLPQMGNP